MNSLENVDGVELVYPYEVSDAPMVKDLLGKYSLNMAAVNCNIKSDDDLFTEASHTRTKLFVKRLSVSLKRQKTLLRMSVPIRCSAVLWETVTNTVFSLITRHPGKELSPVWKRPVPISLKSLCLSNINPVKSGQVFY